MAFGIGRVREGLDREDPWTILKGLNEHIGVERKLTVGEIISLDDITSAHIENDAPLEAVLGYRHNSPQDLKRVLVERGVLSRDLRNYSLPNQDHIVREALEGLVGGRPRSLYFCEIDEFPLGPGAADDVIERNRKKMVRSKPFAAYMEGMGLHHLDDIDEKAKATRGLAGLLGFRASHHLEMRERLVTLGYFSYCLTSLGENQQERVAKGILDHAHESLRWTTSYFQERIGKSLLEQNRRAFLGTQEFGAYLRRRGIHTLDHVTAKATSGLWVLGVEKGQADEFKDALCRYGKFHTDLREYELDERTRISEHIAEAIILRKDGNNWKSAYFNEGLSHEIRDSNRDAILRTQAARGFFAQMASEEDGIAQVRRFLCKLGYERLAMPSASAIVGAFK